MTVCLFRIHLIVSSLIGHIHSPFLLAVMKILLKI